MTAPGNDLPYGQGTPSGQDDVPPTCYRHPDRESWVSCTRCGRHACPDCLRDAAVGQQCVECVRGSNAGGRAARTAFGGRPVTTAVVTWTLVGINVLIFLIEVAKPNVLYAWGMLGTPAFAPGGIQSGVAGGQWYRLITSAFTSPGTSLAGLGFLDIAFNMWALIVVGPSLEQLLGRVRFVALYLLSALGGSVLYYYLQPHGLAAGASGAIYGLFGAWFVVARKLRLDVRGIVTIIAINLAFSLFYRSTIAWQDHVGGLIVGVVTAAAFVYAPRKNRTAYQAGAALLILVVLIVLVVLRTHALTSQLGS
jgi:membrane associated rhomboid family serine protease